MNVQEYFNIKDERVYFTRDQASRFAKDVAGDFNPIHNPHAKRFVVPGDLLFAVSLLHYGLSRSMSFHFGGMVNDIVGLGFPQYVQGSMDVLGENEKTYLSISLDGDVSSDAEQVEKFTKAYVEFSGHTFIDVLVPLMRKEQVMINPDRPLIVYESMAFDLSDMSFSSITLALKEATLAVAGRRGNVILRFDILSNGECIGTGEKRMALSGLRPYEDVVMQGVVQGYEALKAS